MAQTDERTQEEAARDDVDEAAFDAGQLVKALRRLHTRANPLAGMVAHDLLREAADLRGKVERLAEAMRAEGRVAALDPREGRDDD